MHLNMYIVHPKFYTYNLTIFVFDFFFCLLWKVWNKCNCWTYWYVCILCNNIKSMYLVRRSMEGKPTNFSNRTKKIVNAAITVNPSSSMKILIFFNSWSYFLVSLSFRFLHFILGCRLLLCIRSHLVAIFVIVYYSFLATKAIHFGTVSPPYCRCCLIRIYPNISSLLVTLFLCLYSLGLLGKNASLKWKKCAREYNLCIWNFIQSQCT